MGHVTVVFTRRRNLVSAALRVWMYSRFSHCAILDPETKTVIEAVGKIGVRERPLEEMIGESSHHEMVRISCRSPEGVIAAARGQIGKPYDWKGVLGFWFRRNWQDDRAFLCSELVAWSLQAAGEPVFRREAWRISPETLYLPIFDRSS